MRAVFIGGAPRSGTTLLGSLLGGHPECVVTPESSFKVDELIYRTSPENGTIDSHAIRSLLENPRFRTWELELDAEDTEELEQTKAVAEAMFLLARAYARVTDRESATLWVDHTPSNIRYVDRLRAHFPDAKFVHLVRDGRAVSASVLPLNWGPNTIGAAARDWMEHVAAGLAAESRLPPTQIRRVRYEDLVRDSAREVRRLCEFLQIEFRDSMLAGTGFQPEMYSRFLHPLVGRPPQAERISAWEDRLESRDIEMFEALTGDVLACLGYDLKFGWKARWPTLLEKLRMYVAEGPTRLRNKGAFRRRLRRYARGSGSR